MLGDLDPFSITTEDSDEGSPRKPKGKRKLRREQSLQTTETVASFQEVVRELKRFMKTSDQELSFEPMPHSYRKVIHQIAAEFGMKTKVEVNIQNGLQLYTKRNIAKFRHLLD